MNALEPIVRVLEFGAAKYEPDGWKSVPDATTRYYDSLQRHLIAWRSGEVNDPDSGEHHLAHAGCCLVFLLWFEATVHIAKPRVLDLKMPEGWNDPRQEPRDSDGREPEMTDDMQDGSRVVGYVPREDVGFALTDAEVAEAIAARLRKENAQLKESFANLRKAHEENEDAVTKLQIEADVDRADAQANLDIEKKAHEITRGMLAASAQWIAELSGDGRAEAVGADAVPVIPSDT
jgi:hypothetical protein